MIIEENGNESFSLDVKRFYTNHIIKSVCPNCNTNYVRDCNHHCFSYPSTNTPITITGYCSECEHEWEIGKVILTVSIEEVKDK